jgi:predicted XRE-type DNA-binding protein
MPEVRKLEEAHLRLRAELIDALRDVIEQRGLRQREAATLFGVAQPRVSDLVRGKVALFSIDTLVTMLAAAGVSVELSVRHRRHHGLAPTGRPSKVRRRPKRRLPGTNPPGDAPAS